MSLFDRPPNATDDIHLVASYQKHFDRFVAHLRTLNTMLEEYDERCIGFLHAAALHFSSQANQGGTGYTDGVGCALELCVVGTLMPKAIPPFAVCCAALLNTDDEEWSNTGVMHLLAMDVGDGKITVIDPLADFDRLRPTGALDSQFPPSDPRRGNRSSLFVSGNCPTLGSSGCLVDASANHRALLRQHHIEQEAEGQPPRAASFLPYSSTILAGNYSLTRVGANTLTEKEQKISPETHGDDAYQKNVAVCGPQGFGLYARGAFRSPLHFLSMVTGKKEKVMQLPGYQSVVLSNPGNLEQIITVGPNGIGNSAQLHLVSTASAAPELLDTIDILTPEKSSGNGFVSTAVCCHDPENSIVFVVYGAYTAVVRNVPWRSRGWRKADRALSSASLTTAAVDTEHRYRDLAATDHPLIIAASTSYPHGVCLVDVRNLSVLKQISPISNSVLCSVRASDWLELRQQTAEEKRALREQFASRSN